MDAARIGTMGMSMGSTMAWWLAALDERIACCVDICCLTDFDALIESNGLDGHGLYYYVPGLLKEWTTGRINALIAPRPHLALAGDLDAPHAARRPRPHRRANLRRPTPKPARPDAWKLSRYPVGHEETEGMRREALEWLGKHLLSRQEW